MSSNHLLLLPTKTSGTWRHATVLSPTNIPSKMASQNTSTSEKHATPGSHSLVNSEPPSPSPKLVPSYKSRPKSWTWHLLSQLVSLFWFGPIITLLVLNFRSHVIGASIWCPFGKCTSDAFGDNAIATAVRYVHQQLFFVHLLGERKGRRQSY